MSRTFKDRRDAPADVKKRREAERQHYKNVLGFSMQKYMLASSIDRSEHWFAAADRAMRKLNVLDD